MKWGRRGEQIQVLRDSLFRSDRTGFCNDAFALPNAMEASDITFIHFFISLSVSAAKMYLRAFSC